MSLTEKTKKEVLNVYDTWLHSYLNGDVPTYNSFLDDAFHFIGSTSSEEFLNRKDTTHFFEATADQLSGKSQLRNETKIIEQFGEVIFITHLFDAWFLAGDNWFFYDRFRFTNALQKNKNGWKFIYQHYSTPDSKAQEGETIGFDQVTAENLQLREAIQRRTKELEEKNRELEIEGALERIRAKAVAMKETTDLLDIVVSMRTEFIKLGHEAHYFWHMMWLAETYEKAMTSGDGTKIGFVMELPRHIHADIPLLANWEKSKKPTVVYAMEVEEALKYVDKMVTLGDFQHIDPQAPTEDDIRHIGGLTFIMARTTHGEIGYSLPGVVENPPKGAIDILVRFAGAFDLAHRRFLDLQKAEKQARETQIELALEKIRSRSMAMQKSDELKEVIQVVYDQFVQLQVAINHAGFILDYKENEDMHIWLADHNAVFPKIVLPYFDCAHWNNFIKAKKTGQNFFTNQLGFEEKNKFYKDLFQFIPDLPEETKTTYFGFEGLAISTVLLDTVGLYIENYNGNPFSDEENAILMRFGKVFQQTYTRFLDLQKAEAQAREAQIEAALERVRSRSLAMHHSSELSAVVDTLLREFTNLEFTLTFCIINLIDEQDMSNTVWAANPETGKDPESYYMKFEDYPFHHAMWDAWKAQKKRFVYTLEGEEKKIYDEYLYSQTEFRRFPKQVQEANKGHERYVAGFTFFKYSGLQTVSVNPISKGELEILERFGRVFEQAYTRFLDLQKAEAQAREAKIEAALERIRSQSMGMQTTNDLSKVTTEMFNQLRQFGGELFATGIIFCNKHKDHVEQWHSIPNAGMMSPFIVPIDLDYIHQYRYDQWEKGIELFSIEIPSDFIEQHFKDIFQLPSAQKVLKDLKDKNTPMPKAPPWEIDYGASFKYGYLLVSSLEHFEEAEILPRFANVFEQTYTRFLDLQKAESQTREAQINLAVERVRAKALAMHKSEEIIEVVAKLKNEVMALEIPNVVAATIFLNEGQDKLRMWDLSSLEKENDGYQISFDITFELKKKDPNLYIKRLWENQDNYFIEKQEKKDLKRIVAWLRENDKKKVAQEVEEFVTTTQLKCLHHAVKTLNNGKLVIDLLQPPSEEMETILTKMGAGFDLAYKRFEDLKNAEAQAQEAKIEASLEKVRSVALSLKNSDDMLDIAQVLYEQLLELGFTDIRNAIIDIHNDDNETFLDYDYSHDMSSAVTEFSYYGDPVIEQQIKKVQSSNDAFFEIELKGKELEELIETRLRNGEKDDPRLHKTDHLTYNLYSFGNGAIGISNFGILSDTQKKVLKRFRNVFTFAYKRYTDLANAEAQAMEAKIEASLEKVRSVALGLNKSDDMLEVAQALYEQLLALGFTNIRNSIIDIDNGDGLTFSDFDYSHEMGGTVTQMSYKDDPTLKEQLEDIIATTDGFSEMVLEGRQLQDLIDMRRNNGEADDPRLLNTDSLSYILYAFGKGAIGISNFGVLPEYQKSILNRFRNVFTFAYQRYTDLAQSEAQAEALLAEKKQLEKTLKDLQATQKQLIQSEKMASLGELTAGIAHEIQNPLNFVNNFSEVSNELIEEIDEELAKGDLEEVKLLLKDIKQNLEKINHHGKRADTIVKGMLQHSRKSTAEKVPTDINKLADEYLRLAYHGLRAKDKSFNATLETNFDETIGLVSVIPQDMGRVILNLITNAFYATNERKEASKDSDFKPTVSITTRKLKNKVTISVEDNGNGIPQHVVDKIFQPFFTTKPTGEGTGLGLSMSYDIVNKGHGGELLVETKQDKGSTFKIILSM